MKAFDIPILSESLKRRFQKGEITLYEAACELHMAGWHPFVNVGETKKLLIDGKEEGSVEEDLKENMQKLTDRENSQEGEQLQRELELVKMKKMPMSAKKIAMAEMLSAKKITAIYAGNDCPVVFVATRNMTAWELHSMLEACGYPLKEMPKEGVYASTYFKKDGFWCELKEG